MDNNAKLEHIKNGYVFSLPAGFSCPGADKCLTKAIFKDGKAKIVDGDKQQFRCYAAVAEARFPQVRSKRWFNFNLLKRAKSVENILKLLNDSIPKDARIIRVHDSGDFFSKNYLQAWMISAELHPWITFYAYTKSIHLIKDIHIPHNFKLNASYGGRYDDLIKSLKLKHVKVFFSEEEADEAGYALDKTDELAYNSDESFGLLLHGSQRAGSEASKAWEKVRKTVGGYTSKKRSL